jgi:hypothetical protein
MTWKEFYMSSCRSCWWQEGGRCYEGEPERDENGRSLLIVDPEKPGHTKHECKMYKSKRRVLEGLGIPPKMLVITSEETAKKRSRR